MNLVSAFFFYFCPRMQFLCPLCFPIHLASTSGAYMPGSPIVPPPPPKEVEKKTVTKASPLRSKATPAAVARQDSVNSPGSEDHADSKKKPLRKSLGAKKVAAD
eukprot:EG_transcript_27039